MLILISVIKMLILISIIKMLILISILIMLIRIRSISFNYNKIIQNKHGLQNNQKSSAEIFAKLY